jgi:hypothetical protein
MPDLIRHPEGRESLESRFRGREAIKYGLYLKEYRKWNWNIYFSNQGRS